MSKVKMQFTTTALIAGHAVPLYADVSSTPNAGVSLCGSLLIDQPLSKFVEDLLTDLRNSGIDVETSQLPIEFLEDVSIETISVELVTGHSSASHQPQLTLLCTLSVDKGKVDPTLFLVVDESSTQPNVVFGIELDPNIDMSKVPLFGKQLKEAFSVNQLLILYANQNMTNFQIPELDLSKSGQPASGKPNMVASIPKGVSLAADVVIAGEPESISFNLTS